MLTGMVVFMSAIWGVFVLALLLGVLAVGIALAMAIAGSARKLFRPVPRPKA